jgi:hypothetical protein
MLLRLTIGRAMAAGLMLAAALALGSGPAEAARCEDCDPGQGGGAGGGTAKPVVPMIALQLNFCMSALHVPGIDEQMLVEPLKDAVRSAFATMRAALGVKSTALAEAQRSDGKTPFLHPWLWPSPDVRVYCPNANATNVGVWFEAPGAYGPQDTAGARNAATRALRRPLDMFSFRVHDSALKAFLDIARKYAQAKVNQSIKGTPLEGDVWLTDIVTSYDNVAKRVTTRLNGYVEGQLTGENTDFWTVFRETLSINWDGRSIYCSGKGSFDYGSSVDAVVFNILLAVLDPIVDAMNNDQNLDIDAMMESEIANVKGPACQLPAMFPRQMIVPLPLKLVFNYKHLTVSDGVAVGGDMQLVPREPAVTILGPDPLYVEAGEVPQAVYRARPYDMRTPLTVSWETPGGIIVANPNTSLPTIRWNVSVAPGQQVNRIIRVTVTDADGYTRTAQKTVRIRSAADKPDDDPIPTPCNMKPELCDGF